MVAILFRGEGKWGVQRLLHQFSQHLVCSISGGEAAHVDLKGTLLRFTVFALPRIQTVDEFRPAERKHERVWRRVNVSPARSRVSEIFETEEAENARPVLFRPGPDIPILRF